MAESVGKETIKQGHNVWMGHGLGLGVVFFSEPPLCVRDIIGEDLVRGSNPMGM